MSDDRFEPELRDWLREQAPGQAPADLVARGMARLHGTPQRRRWSLVLARDWSWPGMAGAAVVALALALVLLVTLPQHTPPVGPPASGSPSTQPSSTATPLPSGTPQATPVLVPALGGFTTNPPSGSDATWASLTWRNLDAGDPLAQVRSVVRWHGGYLALGADQAEGDTTWTPVWTSADGVTWQPLPLAVFYPDTIVFGIGELPDGGLVALTGQGWADGVVTKPMDAWTSSDGLDWTVHPGPALIPQASLQADMRPLVAAGPAGVVVSAYLDPSEPMAFSPDGETWTYLPANTLPQGFAVGGLAGTSDGYVAVGSVPVDPDHTRGVALWSSDGRHWSSGTSLPFAQGGTVLAATAPSWGADGLYVAHAGFIARDLCCGAPGAELWWQSPDGQHWQLLKDFPPLGAWQGPGPGEGGNYPDGQLVSDGQRIVALKADSTQAWVSADGLHWQEISLAGFPPANEPGQAYLLPGGVLLVESLPTGSVAWYGGAK
jgi:hypothetical protein